MHTVKGTIFWLTALTLLPLATANAQSDGVLEEITVTARKRDESLQEVPIAITAFTESRNSDASRFFRSGKRS